jgi:hypothetical protein
MDVPERGKPETMMIGSCEEFVIFRFEKSLI